MSNRIKITIDFETSDGKVWTTWGGFYFDPAEDTKEYLGQVVGIAIRDMTQDVYIKSTGCEVPETVSSIDDEYDFGFDSESEPTKLLSVRDQ